jgi:hypothetical protein
MKNVIIRAIMFSTICSTSFAMHSVDFSQDKYFCNGTLLTQKTASGWVLANCKNVQTKFAKEMVSGEAPSAIDSRIADSDALDVSAPPSIIIENISFNTDDGSSMKCEYIGSTQLRSCKASASAKKPATSAVVSFSNESESSK